MRPLLSIAFFALASCNSCKPACSTCPSCDAAIVPPAPSSDGGGTGETLKLENRTKKDAVAFLAFGADSVVVAATVSSVCTVDATLNAHCKVPAGKSVVLPVAGQYTNATISFNSTVQCGVTKGEININNPGWYSTVDVSLVDGFSNEIEIDYDASSGKQVIGPTWRATGNEKMPGVYPLHCDICVARQKPTCGSTPGRDGCKAGTQFDPHPPCQWQAPTRNDGASVTVALVDAQPA